MKLNNLSINRIWHLLTEPHSSVEEPRRHLVRVFAMVQVVILFLGAVGTYLTAILGYQTSNLWENAITRLGLITLVCGSVIYGLVRSRYYQVGTFLGVSGLWGVIYAAMLTMPDLNLMSAFLVIPILCSSLYFNWQSTLGWLILSLVGMFAFPILVPGMPWLTSIVVSLFLLIAGLLSMLIANVRQRDTSQIEQQMADIIILNAELERVAAGQEIKLRRWDELALSLGKVSAQVLSTLDSAIVMETLGLELRKFNIQFFIAYLDPSCQKLSFEYLSPEPKVLRQIEKLTGLSIDEFQLSAENWPLFEDVVEHKRDGYSQDLFVLVRTLLPDLSKPMLKSTLRMLGVSEGVAMISIPLLVDQNTSGVLTFWGRTI